MSWRKAWLQVLGVAVLWAALAFAPSAAQAHAGHTHTAAQAVAAPVELPVLTVSVAPRSEHVDRTSHDHDAAELRSAPTTVPVIDRALCGQGCCTGAPCHGCTACTLGADLSMTLPRDAGASHRTWSVLGIAGCDPDGIRKPPKYFA